MCPITQNLHIRMKPSITDALLDELLKNYSQPGDLLGPDGLLTELKKCRRPRRTSAFSKLLS